MHVRRLEDLLKHVSTRIEALEAADDDGGAFFVDIGDEDDPALLEFQRRYPDALTIDIGGSYGTP